MSKEQISTLKHEIKNQAQYISSKGYDSQDLFKQPEKVGNNSWSAPWSDLMMVMFVLFTVLFVYAINNPEIKKVFEQVTYGGSNRLSYQSQAGGLPSSHILDINRSNRELTALFQKLQSKINTFSTQSVSLHMQKGQAVIIRLHGPHIFSSGQASLNPGAVPILLGIADILEMKRDTIQVIGHTQKTEQNKMPANWKLSSRRASNVANFLIQEAGLKADRFTVIAQAAHKPLVPDLNNQKGTLNRRVDIRIQSGRQILTQR